MEDIRAVAELAHRHGKPMLLDACRFAENAWFIRRYEAGYGHLTIEEIVHEMLSWCDGFLVSFKKDGMVNMGGGLFLRKDGALQRSFPGLAAELTDAQVACEGNPTYGGLSGRDIMALVHGLRMSTDLAYLGHRIGQVRSLGEGLARAGVPVSLPTGGHAVYLEIDQFFADTKMKREDFGGVALSASLLAAFGHRTCELGCFSFGKVDPLTGEDRLPELNYLRFAIPRLRYEQQDIDAVVCAVDALYRLRHHISPVDIVYGRELSLRHFKARLRFRDPTWARLLADEPLGEPLVGPSIERERRLAAIG
jgi:tryptophanase